MKDLLTEFEQYKIQKLSSKSYLTMLKNVKNEVRKFPRMLKTEKIIERVHKQPEGFS
jgi:hypothetical protein